MSEDKFTKVRDVADAVAEDITCGIADRLGVSLIDLTMPNGQQVRLSVTRVVAPLLGSTPEVGS